MPETILGNENRTIIDILVKNLVETARACDLAAIGYGIEVHDALETLYRFNMERIYTHPRVKERTRHLPAQMRLVFEAAMRDVESGDASKPVFTDHLHLAGGGHLPAGNETPASIARDYVAGMTDRYFCRQVALLTGEQAPP